MNPTSARGYTLMNPTSARGYTLIEILVAITIIGILFSLGYVSFRDFSRRQAISGTAKIIQGDLRNAQSLAISGQKPDDIFCSGNNILDGYRFKVYSESEYKIEAICTGGIVETKDVNLTSDLTISNPLPNPIIFKSLGQGTNIGSGETSSITLTQVGTTNSIIITITSGGQIK